MCEWCGFCLVLYLSHLKCPSILQHSLGKTLRSKSSNDDHVPIQIYVQTLAATPFATRKQGKPSYYVNLALPLAADIAEPDNNLRMTPRPIGGIRILSANVMEIDGVMGDTVPHKEQIGETEWSGVAFWKLTWVTGGNKAWGRFHDSIRMEAIPQSWGANCVHVPPLFCWWNGVAESVWYWPELGHFLFNSNDLLHLIYFYYPSLPNSII